MTLGIEHAPPLPGVGERVLANGIWGRAHDEEHVVTRVMPATVWTRGPDGYEDFVADDIFWTCFRRPRP